jgi:predicted ATPase
MRFEVIPNSRSTPTSGRGIGYLWADDWNDWFRYQTLYYLTYFDDTGEKHAIGSVKIGQFDMADGQARPNLPATFQKLDDRFFSLGQDATYYLSVMALGQGTSQAFLSALNDLAINDELYRKALEENVTGVSLLRYVNMKTVEGQFRRILQGGVVLTDYRFQYVGPSPGIKGVDPLNLEFEVKPESRPPTNIHVLIGRNGVGKTFILNAMTRALVSSNRDNLKDGLFTVEDYEKGETHESPFANILSITFSAFSLSAKLCVQGIKAERWRNALTTLESDPLFAEAEVAGLTNVDENRFSREAGKIYRRLSSGHKIVLLTITKLVENVEEKTLVLMDEPEAHLHPPLLAAFVRALSDLLINRNGVAIIATHSPVVLQEIPRSCVWKIVRHGHIANAMRPAIETFAENVGILTKEIFGLEVTRSGFHKMLADAVGDEESIKNIVNKFDNEVGSEGRSLISGMIASKNTDKDA